MMRTHHAHRLRMVVHAMLPADFIPDFGDLATCLYSEMVLVYVRLQLHYTEIFIAATHHHVPVLLPPSGLLSASTSEILLRNRCCVELTSSKEVFSRI